MILPQSFFYTELHIFTLRYFALVNSCIPKATNFKKCTRIKLNAHVMRGLGLFCALRCLVAPRNADGLSTTHFLCKPLSFGADYRLTKKPMKKPLITIFAFLSVLFSSCTSYKKIGDLNMISNRNVDSKTDYALIQRYVNESKRDLKKSRSWSIEQAVDNTVQSVPNGEFIKNAKVYIVIRKNKWYYAVSGDVWGL